MKKKRKKIFLLYSVARTRSGSFKSANIGHVSRTQRARKPITVEYLRAILFPVRVGRLDGTRMVSERSDDSATVRRCVGMVIRGKSSAPPVLGATYKRESFVLVSQISLERRRLNSCRVIGGIRGRNNVIPASQRPHSSTDIGYL